MKYRRLTEEELSHLEKEFVDFLVSNTITAGDWVNIKENKPDETERLIEMFSDIVLEKVYSKMVLLEKREPKNLLFFKFTDQLIETLGISVEEGHSFEFTDKESMSRFMKGEDQKVKITGFRTTKVIAKDHKSLEVHQLISSGCVLGNAELFKTLDNIIE